MALFEGTKDLNDLDTRQIYEAAKSLDRVLSQASGTVSGTSHLTPDTAREWVAKQKEKWTNQRTGAGAESFLKSMIDTFTREGNKANSQIYTAQGKLLGSYKDLANHPNMPFILQQHNIPQDYFLQIK